MDYDFFSFNNRTPKKVNLYTYVCMQFNVYPNDQHANVIYIAMERIEKRRKSGQFT